MVTGHKRESQKRYAPYLTCWEGYRAAEGLMDLDCSVCCNNLYFQDFAFEQTFKNCPDKNSTGAMTGFLQQINSKRKMR